MLIANFITENIIGAGIWIVSGIYHVAAWAFEIFLILASGRLLDPEVYDRMLQNFYVVLGIVMLFIVAFGLLKGMVSPDDQKKSATTIRKMVINLVIACISIALLPLVFSFAFDFQDAVIMNNNTFGKFFGYGDINTGDDPLEDNNVEQVKSGAFQIVNGVFTAFFNVNLDSDVCESVVKDTEDTKPKQKLVLCQDAVEGENESYSETVLKVNKTGSFGSYGDYSKNVDEGEIDFNFLLNLVAGLLLIYVGVSYCFDMGVRLVKLVFYQLIGPIPIFLSVIPEGKMNGAFKQWGKITLTCYLEVFVRIFAFYFCLFLCQEMLKSEFLTTGVYDYGIFLGLLAQAFILMGVVMFMRQAPKLFSDITGIDSGNMKLGLKQKMADGGLFAAGALVGGGVTALTRNATNAWQNNKGKGIMRGVNTVRSALAGGVSGAVRSGKAGWSAKSGADMKNAASTGASGAVNARDRRASYKASHGNNLAGVALGHAKDSWQSITEWAGTSVGDSKLGYYTTAAQSTASFNDISEGVYKKKKEYQDQSSIVKAFEGHEKIAEYRNNAARLKELNAQLAQATGADRANIQNEINTLNAAQTALNNDAGFSQDYTNYLREKTTLVNMQKNDSMKKRDVIANAATRLAVDQKHNYADNSDLVAAYEKAIKDSFNLQDLNNLSSLTDDEQKIVTALRNGTAIDDTWITRDNIVKVQDTLDKANINRQHTKAIKEREHIVNTGNRSTEKKDK